MTSVPSSHTVDDDSEVTHTNVIEQDEQDAFLRDVLGPNSAKDAIDRNLANRPTPDKFEHAAYDVRPINPNNKPLHPSVTEQYFTEGGKEAVARHDPMGSFWHVEFVPGGHASQSISRCGGSAKKFKLPLRGEEKLSGTHSVGWWSKKSLLRLVSEANVCRALDPARGMVQRKCRAVKAMAGGRD